jgi:hypothetical protein
MICPPCAEAADLVTADNKLGADWPQLHFPTICRDHDVQPHGCTCQHGQPEERR